MPMTPKWSEARRKAEREKHEARVAERKVQAAEIEEKQTRLFAEMGRQLGLENGAIMFLCRRGRDA